jgi:hypothetical protein
LVQYKKFTVGTSLDRMSPKTKNGTQPVKSS